MYTSRKPAFFWMTRIIFRAFAGIEREVKVISRLNCLL